MKSVMALFLLIGLAVSAQAVNPMIYIPDEDIDLSFGDRNLDYCQAADAGWAAVNASVGYLSELVDDIPESFECNTVTSWDFYIAQWGADWQDPTGIFLNLYNSSCPPDMGPDQEVWYAWNGPFMTADMVYDGDWEAWHIHIDPNDQTHVENPMSFGIIVDNDWGQDPPYCGIVTTTLGETFGACEAQFDGEAFGYPRWTPLSENTGGPTDLAFCIELETTPTDDTSWSSIKSLY